MPDVDIMSKVLEGLVTAGPLAATLGVGVWVLWRKNEKREEASASLTREVLAALGSNTTAMTKNADAIDGLREAIERGEHRPARRMAGAD